VYVLKNKENIKKFNDSWALHSLVSAAAGYA